MVRALKLGSVAIAIWAAVLGTLFAGFATAAAVAPTYPYIVTLQDSVADPAAHAKAMGVTPTAVYVNVLKGYAFDGTSTKAAAIAKDRNVAAVDVDKLTSTRPLGSLQVTAEGSYIPQELSFSTERVGALSSKTARIDGKDQRIDVDVAVIDSGIQLDHPDLNVVGGADCAPGQGFADQDGHGTMVAGFIGAIDNSIGRVGIAPGARLWSIRVARPDGYVADSWLLCGLDWVAANSATIEVANISIAGPAKRYAPCASVKPRPTVTQKAICTVVGRGVTTVVAAGNEAQDAALEEPALMPEVITVSATGDRDGIPGGLGGEFGCLPGEFDDTFASFSNFGEAVDIAAPGVCSSSTFIGGLYAVGSGTSFSSPLVAGAAALYKSTHPTASPAGVREALLALAEPGPIVGDPDEFPEGLLDVSNL